MKSLIASIKLAAARISLLHPFFTSNIFKTNLSANPGLTTSRLV
jgi:hypothetical protein